jgi:hypothetical protein
MKAVDSMKTADKVAIKKEKGNSGSMPPTVAPI